MDEHTTATRRQTIRALLGTSALAGVAGCLGSTTDEDSTPEDGTKTPSVETSTGERHTTDTNPFAGTPTPTDKLRGPFETYLPASMRNRPVESMGTFDVFKPATVFETDGLEQLMDIVFDGVHIVPQGMRVPDLERVVYGPDVTAYEGPISKSSIVHQETQDGAEVVEPYYGYKLLTKGRVAMGVTDGVSIVVEDPRTKPKTLLRRVKSIIERKRSAESPPQAALFGKVTGNFHGGLVVSGNFDWWVSEDDSLRTDYDALAEVFEKVPFIGQKIDGDGTELRATTSIAVDGDPGAYREEVAARVPDENNVGYVSYSTPTVSVVEGLLQITERGPPGELLRG